MAADFPPLPHLDPDRPVRERPLSAEPVAALALYVGDVAVWDRDGNRIALAPETGLQAADVLHLPAGARAHLALATGDQLDLAGEAWLRLDPGPQGMTLWLWQGRALIQALPDLTGRRKPLVVKTPEGTLTLLAGQVGLAFTSKTREVLMFDNQADWNGELLVAGERRLVGPQLRTEGIDPGEAVKWRAAVSPLIPALRQAVTHYEQGEKEAAWDQLVRIQKAFPENALAAYYLGQIALERGDLATGVQQWRHYERLDPEGAKKRHIDRYLVALLSKEIEKEIHALVKQEARLAQKPLPNTIAVAPLAPKAGESDIRARRIGKALAALIVADLNKIPGLRVLERAKLDKLLQELQLSAHALTDPKRSAELGRMLRAERILVGEYRIEKEERP